MNLRIKFLFCVVVVLGLTSFLQASSGPPRGDPVVIEVPSLSLALPAGSMQRVGYTIAVPPRFTQPTDIYFLINTSGGSADEMTTIGNQVKEIIESLSGPGEMVRFGIGEFGNDPTPLDDSTIRSGVTYRRVVDLTTDGQQVLQALDDLQVHQPSSTRQNQVEALFQAVTGAGGDVNQDGDFDDLGDSLPHQQAGFRSDARAFILLWPGASPQRASHEQKVEASSPVTLDHVCDVLNQRGIKVIGISSSECGSSTPGLTPEAQPGSGPLDLHDEQSQCINPAHDLNELRQIAVATRTLVPPGGVDLDGDGVADLNAGEPFICQASVPGSDLAEALRRFGEVSLVPIDNPQTAFDETTLVKMTPLIFDSRRVDLQAGGRFEFEVTLTGPEAGQGVERNITFELRAKIGNEFVGRAEVNLTTQEKAQPQPAVFIDSPTEGQRFCGNTSLIIVSGRVASFGPGARVQARAERDGTVISMHELPVIENAFTCSLSGLTAGPLTIIVTATDQAGAQAMAMRSVRINRQPGANAGTNQTVRSGATVTLTGVASSDPDSDPLMFRWRLVNVSDSRFPIQLMMENTAMPTFVAPTLALTDPGVVYTFELVVSDGCDQSAPVTVMVTVQNQLILRDNRNGNQLTVALGADMGMYEFFTPRTNERFTGTAQIVRDQRGGDRFIISDANTPNRLAAHVDIRRGVGTAALIIGAREFSLFDGNIGNNVP
jgi:hypothetical protein